MISSHELARELPDRPGFASEADLDSGPEGEGQGGIAKGLAVGLAQQILDVGVCGERVVEMIAAAEIETLLGAVEVAFGT